MGKEAVDAAEIISHAQLSAKQRANAKSRFADERKLKQGLGKRKLDAFEPSSSSRVLSEGGGLTPADSNFERGDLGNSGKGETNCGSRKNKLHEI